MFIAPIAALAFVPMPSPNRLGRPTSARGLATARCAVTLVEIFQPPGCLQKCVNASFKWFVLDNSPEDKNFNFEDFNNNDYGLYTKKTIDFYSNYDTNLEISELSSTLY